MLIQTTRFGEVDIDETDIVTFKDGMPGFEGLQRFVIVPHHGPSGCDSPFKWMQSITTSALAFPLISPWQVCVDYAPTIPGSILRELEISSIGDQAQIWAIVTIPRDRPESSTTNLLAPVLINRETKMAKQVILMNEHYALRTPLRIVSPVRPAAVLGGNRALSLSTAAA